jgi:hypothetical protein
MAKFVILYRGFKGMGDTPAEQQRLATVWGAWYQLRGAGIVDGGHPFGGSSTITSDGAIVDGAVSELTGYVIIEATNIDAANDIALPPVDCADVRADDPQLRAPDHRQSQTAGRRRVNA